jgi:hypothetical protein
MILRRMLISILLHNLKVCVRIISLHGLVTEIDPSHFPVLEVINSWESDLYSSCILCCKHSLKKILHI